MIPFCAAARLRPGHSPQREIRATCLLIFDNGDERPAAEGGQYSRALELALDWDSMTASKVWEYHHKLSHESYKYSDKVGMAHRLKNGNTLVLYGVDFDPMTLKAKNPQTFTLVEADADPEAGAVGHFGYADSGQFPRHRAVPVNTLFGALRKLRTLSLPTVN